MTLHLLAIDDDPEFLVLLQQILSGVFPLLTAATIVKGLKILKKEPIDLVLLDVGLGNQNGLDFIEDIKKIRPNVDVVVVTGYKDPKLMVEAVRLGAADFLVKPFEMEEVVAVIEKLAPYRAARERHAAFLGELNESFGNEFIVGRSENLLHQIERAQKLKGQKANVLIEGESGTGKELFARYIHGLEQEANRPFVAINCAAIPENLLESELFGHERGAFTGAVDRKIGKFELANGGDLFLDEVASLKLDLQTKILRAIQEQEVVRIGGTQSIKVSFRVLSASNEPLEHLVETNRFRRDLFHRLRVVSLKIPPLRERKGDIPILAAAFLKKYIRKGGWSFSKSAFVALQQYPWPGNVRELENLIQGLTILIPGPIISISDLPEWLFRQEIQISPIPSPLHTGDFVIPKTLAELKPLKEYIDKAEQVYIGRALELANGDKSKAASLLQMSRTKLYERMRLWERGN